MIDDGFTTLRDALIGGITAISDFPESESEPDWRFAYLDTDTMITSDELTDDEIYVCPSFVVLRNGWPVATVLMNEDGEFQVRSIDEANPL